jgi:hypothetical protein
VNRGCPQEEWLETALVRPPELGYLAVVTAGAWLLGRGDIEAATRALPRGALLDLLAETDALDALRRRGVGEVEALRGAWELAVALASPGPFGRRVAWSRFYFLLPGERPQLSEFGRTLLGRLAADARTMPLRWHIVLVAHDGAEPERTLRCDPGYDLQAYAGRSCLAWVTPYDGLDWREPQRYPTFELLA